MTELMKEFNAQQLGKLIQHVDALVREPKATALTPEMLASADRLGCDSLPQPVINQLILKNPLKAHQ